MFTPLCRITIRIKFNHLYLWIPVPLWVTNISIFDHDGQENQLCLSVCTPESYDDKRWPLNILRGLEDLKLWMKSLVTLIATHPPELPFVECDTRKYETKWCVDRTINLANLINFQHSQLQWIECPIASRSDAVTLAECLHWLDSGTFWIFSHLFYIVEINFLPKVFAHSSSNNEKFISKNLFARSTSGNNTKH